MLHLQGEANRYILKIIPLFSHSRFRLRVCPSAGGRWEMAMKGMTSCSFVFTAPCAVDSYSISTGTCTPNNCSNNLTESFTNKRIIRYLYRKFRDESTPTLRCDCKGDLRGLIRTHSASQEQSGWLDSHGIPQLNLRGYNYEV